MKHYMSLTPMQKLVAKARIIYPDDIFNEIVEYWGNPEFWKNLVINQLSDDQCVDVLDNLLSMYRDYNCA